MKNSKNQTGSALIEVLLASVIGIAISLAAMYVLKGAIVATEDNRAAEESKNTAEDALSSLSAVAPDLSVGGSFTAISDNVLTLAPCTALTCDYVLFPDVDSSLKTSLAKGYPFGSPIPTGSNIAYLRRWRVEDTDADYNLRQIRVAMVKNETDTKPVFIMETVVLMKR
ncbi:MAG: hypothetical protein LH472_04810 [Pyrinomonadaceae bacterium]|nr:hypothetical protein [Pyrinomonadaceae bacterium]